MRQMTGYQVCEMVEFPSNHRGLLIGPIWPTCHQQFVFYSHSGGQMYLIIHALSSMR